MKNIFEKNKDLYDYLSIHCNQTINTTLAVEFLYSTIKAEIGYGLSVPEWVHSVYPEKLIELTATNFKVYTYDDVMKRIKGGKYQFHFNMNIF